MFINLSVFQALFRFHFSKFDFSIVLVVKVIIASHKKGTFAPLAPLSKGQDGRLPPAPPSPASP